MKPLDPRLLRYARSSRLFLVIGALLGLGQTASIIGFAWVVSLLITEAMAGRDTAALGGMLWLLVGIVAVRGMLQWGMDWAGARAAATAKSELREALLRSFAVPGPTRSLGRSTTEITTLASHGLDALDSYFGKYLPQLLLTALATPLLIVVTFVIDPVSGITELLTLPVIPMFMVLIGLATRRVQRGQLDALTSLANAFLELIEGLSTLKIFGRARRQSERIRAITEDYRVSTMKVLRLSFLSGFALELFASLSVALVAVQIGIRLIDNEMALFAGLFALILAPEVFAPIRQVGAQYHAAAEGVAAADEVFDIIEAASPRSSSTALRSSSSERSARIEASEGTPRSSSSERSARIEAPIASLRSSSSARIEAPIASALSLSNITVRYGETTVLDQLDLDLARGRVTAIAGESGAGKSTLFAFLRGAIPGEGVVTLDGVPLDAADAIANTSWMSQAPGLMEGTVQENIALGLPSLPEATVRDALSRLGLDAVDPQRRLGVGGDGLSGGQAQRVAFARAMVRARALDTPLVLFDEPSSALDADREQLVIAQLRDLAAEGRIVVVISHRKAVLAAADCVHLLVPFRAPVSEVLA